MIRVLYVGQKPETVDFTDPALPPGFNASKIQAGIDAAVATMTARGWTADPCMISPDDAGIAMLTAQLAQASYDCVVVGGGLRVPPKSLRFFERVLNTLRQGAPKTPVAFNTNPGDTADAAARWISAG